jgi:DNA repair exonuclease SbcCD nuclease subunit
MNVRYAASRWEIVKMSKYILTADWHLRSQRPRCRLDEDWLETQRKVLTLIANEAVEYEADVIVIGDIFHSTNETTNEVIGLVQEFALTLETMNQKLYILAGNHDLPQHNLDNINRSAFQILLNSKNIYHLNQLTRDDGNFTNKLSASNFGADDKLDAEIVFKHILCFPENEKIPPNDKIVKPSELFAQFENAKYIFTGDYHRQFVYEKGKKKLLNPGCLLRQAADMIDYEPSVILIDFENGKLEYKILPIPDDEKMVTDEYLEKEEMRNNRIEAFIERIKENEQVTFDFIENVHNLMKNNKIESEIKNIILELMEAT